MYKKLTAAEKKEFIVKIYKNEYTDETLDFSDQYLTLEEIKSLSEALKRNTFLNKLNLSSNKLINDEGVAYISDALLINKTIENLNLSLCSIGLSGAKFLADTLLVNKQLVRLNLYGNPLGDEGVKIIFEALAENSSLLEISIEEVEISTLGAEAIANNLINNTTLQDLCMSNISIGERGVAAIIDMLKKNKGLLSVNLLGCNGITEANENAALEMLNSNILLRSFRLYDLESETLERDKYEVQEHIETKLAENDELIKKLDDAGHPHKKYNLTLKEIIDPISGENKKIVTNITEFPSLKTLGFFRVNNNISANLYASDAKNIAEKLFYFPTELKEGLLIDDLTLEEIENYLTDATLSSCESDSSTPASDNESSEITDKRFLEDDSEEEQHFKIPKL